MLTLDWPLGERSRLQGESLGQDPAKRERARGRPGKLFYRATGASFWLFLQNRVLLPGRQCMIPHQARVGSFVLRSTAPSPPAFFGWILTTQHPIIIAGPGAMSIPLQEKAVLLLLDSQRIGSPTFWYTDLSFSASFCCRGSVDYCQRLGHLSGRCIWISPWELHTQLSSAGWAGSFQYASPTWERIKHLAGLWSATCTTLHSTLLKLILQKPPTFAPSLRVPSISLPMGKATFSGDKNFWFGNFHLKSPHTALV